MTDNEKAEPGGPARILIVDDNSVIRKVVEAKLIKSGYVVAGANSGTEALTKLAPNFEADADPNERFDLVLLDIEMPRMDGYEVATHVRNDERLKDLPIIMITSRTGAKHREKAMEIGVNRYLGKPYQEDELMENINAVIGLS